MYTIEEVAEILNFKIRTIRQWIYDGKMKAVKVNHEWRIPKEEVERIREGIKDSDFNIKDAAAYIGVSRQTIYDWISSGYLKAYRVNGCPMIPKDAAERIKAQRS